MSDIHSTQIEALSSSISEIKTTLNAFIEQQNDRSERLVVIETTVKHIEAQWGERAKSFERFDNRISHNRSLIDSNSARIGQLEVSDSRMQKDIHKQELQLSECRRELEELNQKWKSVEPLLDTYKRIGIGVVGLIVTAIGAVIFAK